MVDMPGLSSEMAATAIGSSKPAKWNRDTGMWKTQRVEVSGCASRLCHCGQWAVATLETEATTMSTTLRRFAEWFLEQQKEELSRKRAARSVMLQLERGDRRAQTPQKTFRWQSHQESRATERAIKVRQE
eukprot:3676023-Amphidinium_carterae.1